MYRYMSKKFRCKVFNVKVHRQTVQVYSVLCSGSAEDSTGVEFIMYRYNGKQYRHLKYRKIQKIQVQSALYIMYTERQDRCRLHHLQVQRQILQVQFVSCTGTTVDYTGVECTIYRQNDCMFRCKIYHVQVQRQTLQLQSVSCTGTAVDYSGVQCIMYRYNDRLYRCTVYYVQLQQQTIQVYSVFSTCTMLVYRVVQCIIYKYNGRIYRCKVYYVQVQQ